MHAEYLDFNGLNRVSVFGYSRNRKDVDIKKIWESSQEHIILTGTTDQALNHVLLQMQTAIRDPKVPNNNPAEYDKALMEITEHFNRLGGKGKAIILRDTDDTLMVRTAVDLIKIGFVIKHSK